MQAHTRTKFLAGFIYHPVPSPQMNLSLARSHTGLSFEDALFRRHLYTNAYFY